jgi:penicillin-binding protein 2
VAGSTNLSRRDLLAAFLAAAPASSLGGCAVLFNLRTNRVLVADGPATARLRTVPPGSTLKPFSLLALLESNKLSPADEYFCPGRLSLNGHSLNCSHPYVAVPMNASRAIAYSCNCAVAYFAQRFEAGELSRILLRAGLSSQTRLLPGVEATGRVDRSSAGPASELQALGESGVTTTPLALLAAYKRLAVRAAEPRLAPIIDGLEGSVEYGTSQGARLDTIRVAGKTGSVLTPAGVHVAWFAGFAPSRSPEAAVVILVQGRSGGADAAPIAARMLRDHFASRA